MSKYEEMAKAAEDGRKNWILRHESSGKFIYQLLHRFGKACQIPEEQLKIIPWNEEFGRFRGEPLPLTAVITSAHYDKQNDNWQAGVILYFQGPNHIPRQNATFALIVTEHECMFTVQIGQPGKSQPIDLNVQTQAQQFFDSLSEAIMEAMREPAKKHRVVVHGFAAPAASEQMPDI